MEELKRAQSESGDVADKARQDLSELMRGGQLKPAGPGQAAPRAKKAGRKKR
jgi:hypothetical protein